jgi:hypothetical protein
MVETASRELAKLIREGRVVMMGPIKVKSQFDLLRDHLRAFSDLPLESADYEDAAEVFNRCRESGIHGSNMDFPSCSAALRRELAVTPRTMTFSSTGRYSAARTTRMTGKGADSPPNDWLHGLSYTALALSPRDYPRAIPDKPPRSSS